MGRQNGSKGVVGTGDTVEVQNLTVAVSGELGVTWDSRGGRHLLMSKACRCGDHVVQPGLCVEPSVWQSGKGQIGVGVRSEIRRRDGNV